MQSSQPSLFTRDDTFFGVCQGLGEDLGFNPNYLRVALGVLLLFNPVAVIGAYAAGGAIVFFSRLLVPNRRSAKARRPAETAGPAEARPAAEREPLRAENNEDGGDLAVAA